MLCSSEDLQVKVKFTEAILRAGDGECAARSLCLRPPVSLLPSYFLHDANGDVATASREKGPQDADKCDDSAGSLRAAESIVFAPSVLEAAACRF